VVSWDAAALAECIVPADGYTAEDEVRRRPRMAYM
jgi:hypothetical protein